MLNLVTPMMVVYAVLSLTLIRMLPVALVLPPLYAVLVPLPIYLMVQARVTRIAPVKRVFNAASDS